MITEPGANRHGGNGQIAVYRFLRYGSTGPAYFRHLRLPSAQLQDAAEQHHHLHRVRHPANGAVRPKRLLDRVLPSGSEGGQQTGHHIPVECVQGFGSEFPEKSQATVRRPSDLVDSWHLDVFPAVYQRQVSQ